MKEEEEEAGGRIASLLLRAFQAKHLKSVEAFVLLFAVLERLFIPPVPFVLHFFFHGLYNIKSRQALKTVKKMANNRAKKKEKINIYENWMS